MTLHQANTALTAAKKTAAQAEAASTTAADAVTKAQATLDSAQAEVARAERNFETDDKWSAVEAARRASAQCELRLDQAIARAEIAATKYAEAQAAVLFAQSAVDAAEQAERRKTIDELTERCGDLLVQMQSAVTEIETAFGAGLPGLDYVRLRGFWADRMRTALHRADISPTDNNQILGWLRWH